MTNLLDELHAALGKFVVFPDAAAHDAVTAWVAATHAQPAWECAPRLVVTSPTKRAGKSRLLDVVEATCNKPLVTVNISPAALVRCISEQDPPTVLLDEYDTIFGNRRSVEGAEDLRGLVNAGFGRGRPYLRWDIKSRSLERCETFAMAFLAGIGRLPDTITDRAVIINMRRRLATEPVSPFRIRRDTPGLHDLRGRLHEWISDHASDLEAAEPDMPVEDRHADVWSPLVAVADLAGGDWPQRIRHSCLTMATRADSDASDGSLGMKLLEDVHSAFDGVEFLTSKELVDRLHALDESPWQDRHLTMNKLARMLAPYAVKPRKDAKKTARGYYAEDFADAWARYVLSQTVQLSPTHPEQGKTGDRSENANCPPKCPPDDGDSCGDSSEKAKCPPETAGQDTQGDSRTVGDTWARTDGDTLTLEYTE